MYKMLISVVDAEFQPIGNAKMFAYDGDVQIELDHEGNRWGGRGRGEGPVAISVSADGYEPEKVKAQLRGEVTQCVIGLRS
jgi:hypothetical protein